MLNLEQHCVMIRNLFNSNPLFLSEGMAIIRLVVGALVVYHGLEVFDRELMNGYLGWESFKSPYGKVLVYFGKSSELLAGILLTLGLFTRIGSLLLIGAMLYITFFIGQGRFWYEDQHPFMFAILGLVFFFCGSGIWSIDSLLWRNKN